jgi:hypothetical protein
MKRVCTRLYKIAIADLDTGEIKIFEYYGVNPKRRINAYRSTMGNNTTVQIISERTVIEELKYNVMLCENALMICNIIQQCKQSAHALLRVCES